MNLRAREAQVAAAAAAARNESRLNVGSNKTLIGIGKGSGAAIRGAGLQIGASQQVIIRNLRIYDINPNLVEAGDGITLQESKHIWLDHLRLEQISDGYVDIGSGTSVLDDYITLSYVHFNGRTAYLCGGHHNFVNFVDNGHVTYHHNWFDNGIDNGNTYTGTSNGNTNRDVGGSVFSVPYEYTKQSAADARDAVKKCAGPQPIR